MYQNHTKPTAGLTYIEFIFSLNHAYSIQVSVGMASIILLSEMQQGRQNLSQYGQLYRFWQGWQALEKLSK